MASLLPIIGWLRGKKGETSAGVQGRSVCRE
ncbi:uncharacterized protein G2W53_028771 [Senna tora]|uniref:Uncharacterized protein n=1 Tax=Senna tora TaxID=362788 RepID=A0A834T6I1_9FABA|nr:uncharacterized protein G2W53_028771 [Senna tora]